MSALSDTALVRGENDRLLQACPEQSLSIGELVRTCLHVHRIAGNWSGIAPIAAMAGKGLPRCAGTGIQFLPFGGGERRCGGVGAAKGVDLSYILTYTITAEHKKTPCEMITRGTMGSILKFYSFERSGQVRDHLFHRRFPVTEDFLHLFVRIHIALMDGGLNQCTHS